MVRYLKLKYENKMPKMTESDLINRLEVLLLRRHKVYVYVKDFTVPEEKAVKAIRILRKLTDEINNLKKDYGKSII